MFLFRNYYNFLKLKDKISSEENSKADDIKNIEKQEYTEGNSDLGENLIKETEFPFFTSLALVFALAYVFYKIKKKIRFRRITFLRRFYK